MENKEAWLSLLEGARTVVCYVSGFVDGRDNFKRLLDIFFASTHSSFVVRQSSGSFSSPVRNLVKKLLGEDLKWQQQAGQLPISFDGTPFILYRGTVTKECLRGPARSRTESAVHLTNSVRLTNSVLLTSGVPVTRQQHL